MSSRLFESDSASPGPGAVAASFLNSLASWLEETQRSMTEREGLRASIRVPSFRGCRISVTVLITWTTGLLTNWWLLAWWRNFPLFMEDKKFRTVFCRSCHQTLSSTSCSQSFLTTYASKIDCYSIILLFFFCIFMVPCIIIYIVMCNEMQQWTVNILFYCSITLHVSGVLYTHRQEYKNL
jgi:Fe2+ transport system protein B